MIRFKKMELNLWALVLVAGVGGLLLTGHPVAAIAIGAGLAFFA